MSESVSPVRGRRYGLATVCRVWRVARSGVYRHLTPPAIPPGRPGPVGAMADSALLAAIRAVLAASPFHGEGHRKVWARLRAAGTRTSLRRVLRLMRENRLLAPTRVGAARGPRAHDGTIIPDTVDAMWGTDLTATWTAEGPAAVFIAVDHCSAACVGIHAAPGRRALRRWSRSARVCAATSAEWPGTAPAAWRYVTITARSTCRITSKRNWPSWESTARRPSSAPRKAMAVPSASSAPSRRICCGCGPSRPSRNCGRRYSHSGKPTTTPG